ncbi:MAG: glycosyltransferase family 39 protein, partial [Anaerolineae bacterium]|nr:glycosyltransferase family 39 protein [Anaerolineae bacterium]
GVLDFDPRLGEFAARLPGALAMIALTAITYALAWRLYRHRPTAAWAGLLIALSPYSAVYGATAFTDSLMLALAGLAVLQAARGRWLWSGVPLALAFASKPQALYLLPLAWALGWAMDRLTVRRALASLAPLAVGIAAISAWDGLRAQPISLWALAAANNNPARLIRANEVAPRLTLWLNYARTLVGTPTIVLSAAALVMLGGRATTGARRRASMIDLLLLIFVLAYLLVHWLVAFNVYPRYLLPLLIPATLLGARTVVWLWAWLSQRMSATEGTVLAGALLIALVVGARGAGETRAEFSEDGSDYTGILALADYLNSQPPGAVVYDRWLGWELGFYLGEWTDKRRVYYPTPEALVAGARALDDPAPRYLAAPSRERITPWLDALRNAGFTVEQVYLQQSFAVYRLTPASGA